MNDELWAPEMLRVFVSHSSRNKKVASTLRSAMATYGVSGFVAHTDIEPTRTWQKTIEKALGSCDALVALLTRNFHSSLWTDQEVGYCLGRRKLVVSVQLTAPPYGFIAAEQAIAGRGKTVGQLAAALHSVFLKHPLTRRAQATALVRRFEDSGSFQEAIDTMTRLDKITFLDESLASRIRLAVETNNQVSNAFHVPAKVERLLARHRL